MSYIFTEEHKKHLSEALKGIKRTEESKRKNSIAHKGRHHTEEAKLRMGLLHKGFKHSEESKKKMREISIRNGNKPSFLGQHHSEETKKRLSEVHKGNKYCLGKKLSEEHKRKLSEAKIGKKRILSEETKQKVRLALMGENNCGWKGGIRKTWNGYIMLYKPGHPYKNNQNYVRKQRLVMEEFLGRYLKPEEVVHHIDNNKENNDIENLMLFKNIGEHTKYHANERRHKLIEVTDS